jgi:hypothetical protein
MPAINSDVPIGYRMKGEEMLSFMRQIRRMAGASFPERRESSSRPQARARMCVFLAASQAVLRTKESRTIC